MIIKSHVRGRYFRAAADYLKDIGENEKNRLVEISDPAATNLDEAFQNMWAMASKTHASKPLHHVSLNPFKDERLTDKQVFRIIEHCEEVYGYKAGEHQRVVVEHIKDGRQHFHVFWNRVSLKTGKPVWPGEHWKKSKQAARDLEKELGLKRPIPKRCRGARLYRTRSTYTPKFYLPKTYIPKFDPLFYHPKSSGFITWCQKEKPEKTYQPVMRAIVQRRPEPEEPKPRKPYFIDPLLERAMIIAWAFKHRRADILALYGIFVDFGLG